mmetsp:Transcript_8114/g.12295  ORF Transcript_8114/g.12295 Transcript_8114/m.12295 type:complete len:80 (+) Transcript_8114:583-822(+)
MRKIQNVLRAKILVQSPRKTIPMEGINDGINFIAIHGSRISRILFWILSYMGKDDNDVLSCGKTSSAYSLGLESKEHPF